MKYNKIEKHVLTIFSELLDPSSAVRVHFQNPVMPRLQVVFTVVKFFQIIWEWVVPVCRDMNRLTWIESGTRRCR